MLGSVRKLLYLQVESQLDVEVGIVPWSLSLVPDYEAIHPFPPTRKHNGELERILVPHHLAYTTEFGVLGLLVCLFVYWIIWGFF